MANGEDTAYHPNRRVDPLTRAGMNLVDEILGRKVAEQAPKNKIETISGPPAGWTNDNIVKGLIRPDYDSEA